MNSNHTSWIDGCGPGWGCTADASQEVDFRTPTTLEPSSSPSPAMAPCSAVLGHVMLQENLLIFGICGQAVSQLTVMEPDDKMNHTGRFQVPCNRKPPFTKPKTPDPAWYRITPLVLIDFFNTRAKQQRPFLHHEDQAAAGQYHRRLNSPPPSAADLHSPPSPSAADLHSPPLQ